MKIKISFIKSGLLLLLLPLLAFAHGISEEDKQRMLDGGYLQYVGLGASHMLTGYDHLLFLLGVVFFLISFKDIVKFVTAFTVGHCITLVFATYFQITWNFWLVDAIIAVSVIYKGFDNNGGFQTFQHVFSKSTGNCFCVWTTTWLRFVHPIAATSTW